MILFDEKGWFISQKVKIKIKLNEVDKISYSELKENEGIKPKLKKKRKSSIIPNKN